MLVQEVQRLGERCARAVQNPLVAQRIQNMREFRRLHEHKPEGTHLPQVVGMHLPKRAVRFGEGLGDRPAQNLPACGWAAPSRASRSREIRWVVERLQTHQFEGISHGHFL